MTISEQIETMISSLTDNNLPPRLVTITKAYSDNTVDIQLSDGEINKNIKCSGRGVKGTKALLTYENGEQNHPYVILFEDATQTITSLGLGLFHIYNGDLYLELPNGIPNPFTITDNNLTVNIDGYKINDEGELEYERWDY